MAAPLQCFLVISLSISLVYGQLGTLTGPVREYEPLTGAQQRRIALMQDPQLLQLAAMANERVFIELNGLEQGAFVQEGVNTNIDCLPWLRRFPGGSIQWFFALMNEDGTCKSAFFLVLALPV